MNYREIAAAVVMGIAVSLTGCGQEGDSTEEPTRPVRAIKVGDAEGFAASVFPGRAEATQEVELSFRVSGPLITRPVDVGDRVEEGQVVARIDPRDYEVALTSVRGELERAVAVRARAEADFRRVQNVFQEDPGAVSEAAVDQARQSRDSARAEVLSLTAAVAAAEDQLEYTTLASPYDGVVVATYVEAFEDVRPKQPVLRIVDKSRIEMRVNIPESLINLTPYVTDLKVTYDALPGREFDAEFSEIGREASRATRTYPVTVIHDQPDDATILPGMAGRVSGSVEVTDLPTVDVPVGALFAGREGNDTFVWVIDDETKTLSQRQVTVDRLAETGAKISDGLKSGEWIVVAGVSYLREGERVSILPVPEGGTGQQVRLPQGLGAKAGERTLTITGGRQ